MSLITLADDMSIADRSRLCSPVHANSLLKFFTRDVSSGETSIDVRLSQPSNIDLMLMIFDFSNTERSIPLRDAHEWNMNLVSTTFEASIPERFTDSSLSHPSNMELMSYTFDVSIPERLTARRFLSFINMDSIFVIWDVSILLRSISSARGRSANIVRESSVIWIASASVQQCSVPSSVIHESILTLAFLLA